MPKTIHSVFVVTKGDNPHALTLCREVCAFLDQEGVSYACCDHIKGDEACMSLGREPEHELVLVLGGDGTFIAAARRLLDKSIPLLGINMGQVGFLTELSPDDWRDPLASVLDGGYTLSRRIALSYSVQRGDTLLREGVAINDIIVSRGKLARLVRLGFSYNGRSFISMRSDGVIISTPTGSTAYAVSAGGPLLVPGLEAFSVVPICPFLNGFKPMVMPAGNRLDIQVQGKNGDVYITEDGQDVVNLEVGDVVHVERAEKDLLLAETPAASYFNKLKTKGFLLER